MDLLSGKSPDGFHGLRWNMLVSSGLRQTPPGIKMLIWPLSHQDIPGFESGRFREFPAEHVGECTVLTNSFVTVALIRVRALWAFTDNARDAMVMNKTTIEVDACHIVLGQCCLGSIHPNMPEATMPKNRVKFDARK